MNFLQIENKGKRKTWNRSSLIKLVQVDSVIELHNGKRFVGFKITNDMIGHKLGEFVATRKQCFHNH
ncbi:MAG: ribosomal protein S19 family protein [Candidatus Hodgkinia cicadicola]